MATMCSFLACCKNHRPFWVFHEDLFLSERAPQLLCAGLNILSIIHLSVSLNRVWCEAVLCAVLSYWLHSEHHCGSLLFEICLRWVCLCVSCYCNCTARFFFCHCGCCSTFKMHSLIVLFLSQCLKRMCVSSTTMNIRWDLTSSTSKWNWCEVTGIHVYV